VCSINPAFKNSTENHPSGTYFEPIAGDNNYQVTGYLKTDGDSPVPVPYYIVPIPSPPPSGKDDEGQTPKPSDADPTGSKSPDSKSVGDAGGERYLGLSATNDPTDAYTKLQLNENNTEKPSTDSVGASSQLTE